MWQIASASASVAARTCMRLIPHTKRACLKFRSSRRLRTQHGQIHRQTARIGPAFACINRIAPGELAFARKETTVGQGTFASGSGQGNEVLTNVREGMAVYDFNRNHIGTVRSVYLGEASSQEIERGETPGTVPDPAAGTDTLANDIAKVFDTDEVPDVIRKRLLMSGFIRLDAYGLFAADRYILPEQIARVDEHVHLKVTRDSLIKR